MDRSPVRGAARLAAILDSLPEALLLIDAAGRVVNANAVALGWFEGNGAPLVGRSITEYLSGFGTALARVAGDAGTGGMWADPGGYRSAPGSGPERMVAKLADGSAFPAEITRSFLPREHGGLEVVVVRDVSGVADAEQELRRQQKQTELILRAATEGIVGVDLGGRVVLVNPAAARILKYRASELGGMEFERLVRGDSPVAETLRTGRKHRLGAGGRGASGGQGRGDGAGRALDGAGAGGRSPRGSGRDVRGHQPVPAARAGRGAGRRLRPRRGRGRLGQRPAPAAGRRTRRAGAAGRLRRGR